MRYLLRALALATLLVLPAMLLAGCNGDLPGTSSGAVSREATGPVPPVETAPAVVPGETKGAAKHADPNQVLIDNFTFRPLTLAVAAGTKVTWVNRDDVPHTTTSTRKPRLFDSGTLDTDDQFAHVFSTPGTYEYFCAVHPHMTGKIIVK
jgi:plastocyanin